MRIKNINFYIYNDTTFCVSNKCFCFLFIKDSYSLKKNGGVKYSFKRTMGNIKGQTKMQKVKIDFRALRMTY